MCALSGDQYYYKKEDVAYMKTKMNEHIISKELSLGKPKYTIE